MLSAVVLGALVIFAAVTPLVGRPATPFLAAVSTLWLMVNHGMEGEVLWVVSDTHGLTAADFAGIAGLLVALVVLVFGGAGGRR